jgi:hypothetical protein
LQPLTTAKTSYCPSPHGALCAGMTSRSARCGASCSPLLAPSFTHHFLSFFLSPKRPSSLSLPYCTPPIRPGWQGTRVAISNFFFMFVLHTVVCRFFFPLEADTLTVAVSQDDRQATTSGLTEGPRGPRGPRQILVLSTEERIPQ